LPVLTRRSFLKAGGLAGVAGLGVIGGDCFLWEPNRPIVVAQEIWLSRLPRAWDGLRVVQLSDLHYDPHFSVIPLRKAVEIINPLKPDLVLITGDFVTTSEFSHRRPGHPAAAEADPCSLLLQQIKSRLGIFASLGNHDASADPDRISEILTARGITVLRNGSQVLEQQGGRLWLAGIDDILDGDPDLDKTLEKIPPDECAILLAHEPDFALQVVKKPVDLQLSGHSHGGQVRFPLVGAVVLPHLAHRFPMGLRKLGNLTLYTNIGLGTINLPIRWNCPPEITLFTLRSAKVA
jgi:predicted MPP superfamily phosphohydrolase